MAIKEFVILTIATTIVNIISLRVNLTTPLTPITKFSIVFMAKMN